MVRLPKIVMSADIILIILVFNWRENLTEKRDIEKKQKVSFLLISAKKDLICSGIHFHETVIIFSQFYEILVKPWRF